VPTVQPGRISVSRFVLSLLVLLCLSVSACNASEESSSTTTGATSEPTSTAAPSPTTSTDVATASTTTTTPGIPGPAEFTHPAGFTFRYPVGWMLDRQLISTEFASENDCVSVVAVDEELPSDSGQAGFRLQSVVQFCTKEASGQSLEQYLESTYGAGIPGFQRTEIDGRELYRSDDGNESLIFTEVEDTWLQIATSVAAEPGLEEQRLEEVAGILESVELG
jgi:hypothetical protein